jgi:imidazolonepropionase-like amidohydrolase
MEAIQVSTFNSARLLKMDDRIGSIEEGKLADLVVFEGNPLEDIRLLLDKSRMKLVIQGGRAVVRRNGAREAQTDSGLSHRQRTDHQRRRRRA